MSEKTSSTLLNGHMVMLFLASYALVAQMWIPTTVRPFVLTVGAFAVFSFCCLVLWRQSRGSWPLRALMFFGLLYWLVAFPAAINGGDDNRAYLIYARDFFDAIGPTIQPLSERRLFSVGGQYTLQAPVLRWFGVEGLNLVEPVFGLMLLFALLTGWRFQHGQRGVLVCIGGLLLTPLLGSRILANTASVYILAAFTLALLTVGAEVLRKRIVTWTQASVLALVPLAGATFRPTTLPFNVSLALVIVAFVLVNRGRNALKLTVSAAVALVAFFAAVYPYHGVSETFLYPVLGRGRHITAFGFSTSDALSIGEQFETIGSVLGGDPLFFLNLLLFVSLRGGWRLSRPRWALSVVYALYIVLCTVIVIQTAGLAASRYSFPVGLALACVQSVLLTDSLQVPRRFLLWRSRFTPGTNSIPRVWTTSVLLVLVGAWLVAGESVSEQRLRMHNLRKDAMADVVAASAVANDNNGTVLLVSSGYERFMTPLLDNDYLIMDQPGMMFPPSETDVYTEALANFLAVRDVRTVVMQNGYCDSLKPTSNEGQGWAALMKVASDLNASALCEALATARTIQIGVLDVASF